ncbi:MAG: hypothetical protein WDW36_008618 [Sanguina aurantia]
MSSRDRLDYPRPAALSQGRSQQLYSLSEAHAKPPAQKTKFQTKGNALLSELITSGISVATATACTNPLDVIKTRMQLHGMKLATGVRTPNMVHTAAVMIREEGMRSMYKGLPAALTRSALYGGIRLGLYGPIKELLAGQECRKLNLWDKIVAGSLSGGIAAVVTSPLELIKTRLQVKGGAHVTSAAIVKHVVATEGIVGLWRGAVPGMVRAAALTASQCATYDEVKRMILTATGWKDDFGTHVACSMVTGLVVTTVTNPIDVIKTLVFVSGTRFKTPMEAAAFVWAKDGLPGFFKGWTAYYARLGPQTVITFVIAEWLRKQAGMGAF